MNVIDSQPRNRPETPETYRLRRLMAAAALCGVLAVGGVVANAAISLKDRVSGTPIPDSDAAAESTGDFVPRIIQPGENLTLVASDYTDSGHRVTAGVDNLVDQLGTANVAPGDRVFVPPTTVPQDQR